MVKRSSVYELLTALAGGLVLGSAFLRDFMWVLIVPGLFLLMVLIYMVKTNKAAFFYGWLFGTAKMCVVLGWMWTTYPLSWMAVGPVAAVPIIAIYWFLSAAVIGLGCGVAVVVCSWLAKKTAAWIRVVTLPLVLCGGEILGALLFSIFMLGEGSTVNASFSYGHAGYLLVDHSMLRYLGLIGGVYILSYVAYLFGEVARIISRSQRISQRSLVTIFVVAGFIASGFVPATSLLPHAALGTRIATVNTEFEIEDLFDTEKAAAAKEEMRDAIQYILPSAPAYILLPEDAKYTELRDDADVFLELSAAPLPVTLIDSYRTTEAGQHMLRAFLFESDTQSVYVTDKQYLVPQGEYIPYVYQSIFWLLGQGNYFAYRTLNTNLTPGVAGNGSFPEHMPLVMFCSENIPPLFLTEAKRERNAPFVVNPIAHSWFNTPHSFWNQTRQMTALHALMARMPIVQSGNLAQNFVFDSWGNELEPIVQFRAGSVEALVFEL